MNRDDYYNKERQLVWYKFGCRCAYCGHNIDFSEMEVDHKIPKSSISFNYDDLNDFTNKVPSCPECNHLKDWYDIETFRLKIKLGYIRSEKYTGFSGKFYFESYKDSREYVKKEKPVDSGPFGEMRVGRAF